VRPSFDVQHLSKLRETDTTAELSLKLLRDGVEIFTKSYPMEMLPYNQWAFAFPHASACFVMPNEEALHPVLGQARAILQERTGSSALEGYQSGPDRAGQIAAALHDALIDLRITYINPPAGYERLGQKVLLHRDVLRGQMGTCLDLTYLNCAMLERAGVHPVFFLINGHAFYGCWVREDVGFPEAGTTRFQDVADAVNGGLLVPVNSTTFTGGGRFHMAVGEGVGNLSPDTFFCAVDVRRARESGVRPLPV
jgi:hypothetical protein